ncbi:MAG: 23S rRNA (adenine(2503)-C(2))-methyltransferase RlmN [Mucinivorans sp.]
MEQLLGKNLESLTSLSLELGLRRFVGAQLAQWLYPKRATEWGQMVNISPKIAQVIAQKYEIGGSAPLETQLSVDGTQKFLFPTLCGGPIEAVYIPSRERATLCVSSQSGCRMGCKFCMTARVGYKGNLTAGEIVAQVLRIPQSELLTNIVYMGMGEPMDNIEEVLRSIEIITAPWGLGWSPSRITVSTIGKIDGLRRFLDESRAHLAISLHNPFDHERLAMMPAQGANPIAEVMELIRGYNWRAQRRLSFEYIMFEGVNDSLQHLEELRRLLHGLECRVNLIRFHEIPNSPFRGSSDEKILEFNHELNRVGVSTTTRSSRGEDILAACGLLSATQATGQQ